VCAGCQRDFTRWRRSGLLALNLDYADNINNDGSKVRTNGGRLHILPSKLERQCIPDCQAE